MFSWLNVALETWNFPSLASLDWAWSGRSESLQRLFADWLGADPDPFQARLLIAVVLLSGLLLIPLLVVAGYGLKLAANIIETRTFPPTGVATVGRFQNVTGNLAVKRGRLLQGLCLVLVLATLTLTGLFWFLVQYFLSLVP